MKLYLRFSSIVITLFLLQVQQAWAQQPNASFTQNTAAGCAPLTVNFSNSSSGAIGYFWDFGNGNTSVLTNPSNVYSLPGTYTVKLFATSASGQTDSLVATNLITVSQSPVAGFYPATTTSCLDGNSFSFVNTSVNGATWLWDFGDGNTSTAQNPVHHYTAAGIYTVQLIATNANGCSNLFIFPQCVQVYPKPSVTFSSNITTACDTSQVFQFNTSGTATSYLWDFGDGNNSTAANPAHSYSNPGSYNVSLIVTNSYGCADTVEQNNYITILNPQTPSFSANDSTGCAPFQVMFTSLSTNGQAWYWDFGDGNNSTLQHPSHTYQNPGSYTVSLTVTYPNGCSYTRVMNSFITASGNPVPLFTASNTSGCWPLTTQFTNLSTNATNYMWEFGNNYTSVQPNPSYTYIGNGSYTVKLHAYSAGGCHSVYQLPQTINVTRPSAQYTASSLNGCAPHAVNFTANYTNLSSYTWDFGDGNTSSLQNPSHTYALPGSYSPRLVVTDAQGCTDTVLKPAHINVINTAANFSPPAPINGCAPYTASFSDATPGAVSWLWNFGDGNTSTQQNPSHTYTTPGLYTVSLLIQVSSGCSQYYNQFRIYNIESINAGAVFTQTQCSPFTVTFSDTTSNAVSWAWDFGDGGTSNLQNPVHSYPGAGLYTVSLTATTQGGCASTIIMSNAINYISCANASGGPPSNNNLSGSWQFPPVTGCVPLSISFNDVLEGATAWAWDFGDNNTSTLQNPSHTYTLPGVYTVRMIGYYPSGISDTVAYTNYVVANGTTADFTMASSATCQSTQVTFTNTSQNATAWNWSFGDGNTSTLPSPIHTYNGNNHNYNIILTASDQSGCSSAASMNIFSSTGMPIWANAYTVCVNTAVNFSCATSYTSYFWDFGDGNNSTLQNPSHTYTAGGTYTVTLTVTDVNGCPQTITLPNTITVKQAIVNFSHVLTGTCNSLSIQFNNLSTGIGVPVSNHIYWNYGDNTGPQYGANPVHNYTSPGTYMVTLTGAAAFGCNSSISMPVDVYPTQANFSYTQNTTCFPITATFIDSSYNAVSWLWDFGDGNTSTLQNPSHTYTSLPTSPITLTITDVRGCTSTITRPNIQVFNTDFAASSMNGCGPLTVSFSDSSLNATAWTWNFGDGNTSTLQNPVHTYTDSGSYNVILISQTADGCIDTMALGPVNVYKPTASFISPSSAACAPSMVSFTDQSAGAATWFWDFGDGTYSNAQNPSHIYSLPGNYTITLIVGSSIGCYDTLVRTDYVHVLGPVASFTVPTGTICAQNTVQFNNLTTGASVWNWNFGDGHTSTQSLPSHTYQNSGQYTVSLIVYDTLGCSSNFSLPSPIQVSALPVSSFSASDTSVCAPATVTFTDQSTGALQWTWDFGDGNYSSASSPSHTYNTPGTYHVQLAVTNAAGCTDTSLLKPITVNPKPVAAFASDVTSGCAPLQVGFTDASASSAPLTWVWDFGNNTTSATQSPIVTYTNPGFYNVSLTATNVYGCSDTAVQSSYIYVFDTIAPAASSLLTATVTSDTSTFIVWAPTNAVDFAAYIIYRSDAQSGTYQQIATITSSSAASFADNGVNTLHNTYCYKVQTVDFCGYSLPLDSLTAHCTMNVTATAGGTDINISWTPYMGATVSDYKVYRMEPGNPAPVLVATVPSTVLSVADTSIICPSPYSYRVKASNLNQLAISSSSDTAVARPAISPLAGQKVDVVRSTVINNSSVLTEWKAPSVEPQTVTGYNVYRSEDNEQFTLIASLPEAAFAYIDNNVDVSEQNYFYRVEIVNSCGMQLQGGNAGSSILLSASPSEHSTILSWTPYEGWDMGVDYYVIEKQNGSGEWEIIKIVDGNTLEYEDK